MFTFIPVKPRITLGLTSFLDTCGKYFRKLSTFICKLVRDLAQFMFEQIYGTDTKLIPIKCQIFI